MNSMVRELHPLLEVETWVKVRFKSTKHWEGVPRQ